MAEELALDQARRERGAVDVDEGPRGAPRARVERARRRRPSRCRSRRGGAPSSPPARRGRGGGAPRASGAESPARGSGSTGREGLAGEPCAERGATRVPARAGARRCRGVHRQLPRGSARGSARSRGPRRRLRRQRGRGPVASPAPTLAAARQPGATDGGRCRRRACRSAAGSAAPQPGTRQLDSVPAQAWVASARRRARGSARRGARAPPPRGRSARRSSLPT